MEHHDYSSKVLIVCAEFSEHDFDCFHDCIIDACDKHLNQEELIEVWSMLPINIQCTALEYGMSDTVFRDEVFAFVEENKDKFEKYTTWID